MAENKNTGSPQLTNTFSKNMVKDLDGTFVGDGAWTHARNAINGSHDGMVGVIGNEPANLHCLDAPYTVIATIQVSAEEWAIFSTDDIDSEIGVFHAPTCTYSKKVNDRGLGFSTSHLITGASRGGHKCNTIVYFQDGLNPDRKLDLDNIPYKLKRTKQGDCYIEVPTTILDTEKLRIAPLLTIPSLDLKKGKGSGSLMNGTYQVALAYSVNQIRVTDYLILSQAQSLFDHNDLSGSLELTIGDTDEEFDQVELVTIAMVNQQAVAKRLGFYSTRQKSIYIDTIHPEMSTIPLSYIPLRTPSYEKSDAIHTVNDYLLRVGVYTKPEFNYQPQANNIRTRWVAVHYPADYYEKGGNHPSYMPDEQYSFFIRWVHNTGDKSTSTLISGRAPEASDLVTATGADASGSILKKWQVYNTATVTSIKSQVLPDGGVIVAEGSMGYWESTEKYPDNKPEIWGSLCGKNIRHHKFPDNTVDPILNHHTPGGDKIRVLGVVFDNITPPLDSKGNPVKSIVGYEILRGSREGQKTIIAKGIINNMREYDIPGNTTKGLYQNFPYNDLSPDHYHTQAKAIIDKGSANDQKQLPLDKYRKDIFSFHSPDTNFTRPFLSSSELKIYSELSGTVEGQFEAPYKHPRVKLPTNAISTISKIASFISLANKFLGSGNVSVAATDDVPISSNLIAPLQITPANGNGGSIINGIAIGLKFVSDVIVFSFLSDIMDEQVTKLIVALIPKKQYALQYNSHALYNQSARVFPGNIRRQILDASYIQGGLQSFGPGNRINNQYRGNFVAIKLDAALADPTQKDTSRKLLSDSGVPGLNKTFNTNTSAYYAALKTPLHSQYGQIGSIKQVPISSEVHPIDTIKNRKFTSGILFGGDIYVNRYSEKNAFCLFNDWMYDMPDEMEYDYRNAVNIPYPRYWMAPGRLTYGVFKKASDIRHLNRPSGKDGKFNVENAYFYLFCNGVRDFFVESEVNLAYRDWEEQDSKRHYDPKRFTDIQLMFRSDIIKSGNFFKYDYSLSVGRLYNNYVNWGDTLPVDYNPYDDESCYSHYPNRIMYSLPQNDEAKKDAWSIFLVNNYKDFSSRVTAVKPVNKTGALIMLQDESPVQFNGVDSMQTDGGTKITIGDGELFKQATQNISNADSAYQFGSCDNRHSVISTPHGIFWISQETGKIFQYAEGMKEISGMGLKAWFSQYLPSFLTREFPRFELTENPIIGVGCQAVYDSTYELLYFTKKDYEVRAPFKGKLLYSGNDSFTYGSVQIKLGDPLYFEDASWTVSFDPKTKGWLAYHDWNPSLVIPAKEHFLTVQNKGIWKHNTRTDLYCNYYGQDYPFEIEYVASSGQSSAVLRNVEFILECYKYSGRNRFHVLDFNFDRAIIHNTEQISGMLQLTSRPKENPMALLEYPKVSKSGIEILYSKEENKYRFNQFWDVTRNRGEFKSTDVAMFELESNGYIRKINPNYVNYSKGPFEHKKFRHYANSVFLRRIQSGPIKMLFKMVNSKINPSAR